MKRFMYMFVLVIALFGSGFGFIRFYSYIFAREVKGVILNIEKPTAPTTIVGTNGTIGIDSMRSELFNYAVAIQMDDGEILTASSSDRQWVVAEKGKCVVAKFYPYPPWDFDRSGTYFKARLMRMFDCAKNNSDSNSETSSEETSPPN